MPHFALWSIWRELSLLYKLFLVILFAVSSYSLVSAIVVIAGIRSLRIQQQSKNITDLRRSLLQLRIRCNNVRSVIGSTFYFFGFIFFLSLPGATHTLGDGPTPGSVLILQNFVLHFVFAANVFFVFWILHLVQSFASRRLDKLELQLINQE